jgi:PAS domain S-box-containing protein
MALLVQRFETETDRQVSDAQSPSTLGRARTELSSMGRLFGVRGFVDRILEMERARLARRSAEQSRAFAVGGWMLVAGVALAIVLALLMGWLLTDMIARPVAALTQVMLRLAGGDLRVEAPAKDRRDEVGDMARAVAVFRDAVIEKQRLETEAVGMLQARRAHEAAAAQQMLDTERARAREAEHRRWVEMAEEIAGVGHWRRDMRSGEAVWSTELFRIYGLDPALGALSLPDAILMFHPDDQETVRTDLDRAARDGVGFARDLRVVRPDGELRYVVSRAAAERGADGSVISIFGVFMDVTEAKRAEQVLRESEERYRLLAENVTDVIVLMNIRGEIRFISPSCLRMLGFTPEELDGRLTREMMHPDDAAAIVNTFIDYIAAGPDAAQIVIQYRAKHKDGHWVWIEGQPRVLFDSEGEPIAIQDSIRDITERKVAEEQQLQMVHELNHRVKNTLATVQSMAMHSQQDDPAAFVTAFNTRVVALAQSHDLLTQNAWSGASLRDLVAEQVKGHEGPDGAPRVKLVGPDVRVTPKAAVALGMALGELAANAARYGALSAVDGCVMVSWEREGGPPVSPPTRRGFGARLIERGLTHELGGSARLTFEADGATCEIEFPLLGDAA